MITTIEIMAGYDKSGQRESVESLVLRPGHIYSIVGNTGAGKTQLMEDIESLNDGEGLTSRTVLINGQPPEDSIFQNYRSHLIAHLSQTMNYIVDMQVLEFLSLRKKVTDSLQGKEAAEILSSANQLSGEKILPDQLFTKLSGGQSRALMIADVALNSNAPIVLIDEVENAGIDRVKAMSLLVKQEKIVLMATHDPLLALLGDTRIVLVNGGIRFVLERTSDEHALLVQLNGYNEKLASIRQLIRTATPLVSTDLEIFQNNNLAQHISNDFQRHCIHQPVRQEIKDQNVPDPHGLFHPFLVIPLVFIINRSLLPESEWPKSFEDLLHPRFAYLYAFGGLHNSAGRSLLKSIWYLYGYEAAKQYAEKAITTTMPVQAFQMVKAGEVPVAIVPTIFAQRKGIHNLVAHWPTEGAIAIPSYIAVNQRVQAKDVELFTRTIIGEEHQQLLRDAGDIIPAHPSIACSPFITENNYHLLYPTWEFYASLDHEAFYDICVNHSDM